MEKYSPNSLKYQIFKFLTNIFLYLLNFTFKTDLKRQKQNQINMVVQAVAKRVWAGGPDHPNKFIRMIFKFSYNYGWSGRRLGMHYHDACFEPAPEVQEALRRYRIADPYGYDMRQKRIIRAGMLAMNSERLPKEEWTKYEEDTWYLGSFLDEIEAEKLERVRTTGIKPQFHLKPEL